MINMHFEFCKKCKFVLVGFNCMRCMTTCYIEKLFIKEISLTNLMHILRKHKQDVRKAGLISIEKMLLKNNNK